MGISTGDLLQIIDKQVYLGEELMNVYYYRYSSAPAVGNAIYEELLGDFRDNIVEAIVDVQVTALEHTELEIKNLSSGVEFAILPINLTGVIPAAEEALAPSYVSINFRLLRDSLVTRNGSKRISGLTDLSIEGNEFVGYNTQRDAIEVAMGQPLYAGAIEVAYPVIVKRPIVPPVGTGYVYSSVASVVYGGLGTQNTRKP